MSYVCYSAVTSKEGVGGYFLNSLDDVVPMIFTLFVLLVAGPWFARTHSTAQVVWPQFLAIGSSMDEAWQILNHIRNIPNPWAITSNPISYLFGYLFSPLQSYISAQVARVPGAKSYRYIGAATKMMAITYLIVFFIFLIIAIAFVVVAVRDVYLGQGFTLAFVIFSLLWAILLLFYYKLVTERLYPTFLSPLRWSLRRAYSLGGISTQVVTYVVRKRGWSVLQAMAMGLEGYRFELPLIERYPSCAPKNCVKHKDMPKGAEQRALARRNEWISSHIADVSQTFSKMVVTATDLDALLRTVEADQSLVHAAYYKDDDCIAQIADWIAGRG